MNWNNNVSRFFPSSLPICVVYRASGLISCYERQPRFRPKVINDHPSYPLILLRRSFFLQPLIRSLLSNFLINTFFFIIDSLSISNTHEKMFKQLRGYKFIDQVLGLWLFCATDHLDLVRRYHKEQFKSFQLIVFKDKFKPHFSHYLFTKVNFAPGQELEEIVI